MLLDIRFGADGSEGLDLLRRLRGSGYQGLVCVVTGFLEPELVLRAVSVGADDFLVKGPRLDLVAAVRERIALGREGLLRRWAEGLESEEGLCRLLDLDPDQARLLRRYCDLGCPPLKDLAKDTGVTVAGLEQRIRRIKTRLGGGTLARAVALVTAASAFVYRALATLPADEVAAPRRGGFGK